MASNPQPADPIAAVFPADTIEARFVVAMAIARNDIDLALRDGIAAAQQDREDFTYRVRLATSHLVEALDSLRAYTQESAKIRKLMDRVPAEYHATLKKARSVIQKVGDDALEQIRNNTFHFPSPTMQYSPSSDEQLRDVLASMGNRPCEVHLDHRGKDPVIALSFASDVALALALAKHSADDTDAREQFELTGDGAVAFSKWVDALVVTYLEVTDSYFGTPRLIDNEDCDSGK